MYFLIEMEDFPSPCEQWKNRGCLGCIVDYTTQLYGYHNKPLQKSLLTNQYNGK